MQRADIGLRQDEAFLRRAFHKSLLPCVLSILSQNINILADGIIVGQRIGTDGLSAINLCVPVYLVLCIVGSFLVSGTAIQASRAIGRRQTEQSGKLYNTAVWSCVAAGIAVTAAGLALCAPISALLCPDETVRPLVMEYNLVTLIGALPKILIYVPFWFLRMDGDNYYGNSPTYERISIHPSEPLEFFNMDGTPGATCLIWEHVLESNGKPCSNPRVIIPRDMIEGIVPGNEPQEVNVRSFGVRMPPSTAMAPNYGVMGMVQFVPISIAWLWRLVSPRGFKNPSIADTNAGSGLKSEGVGSYWPFATGMKVTQANLLLHQMMDCPNTLNILIPNQHIGAYNIGFMGEWITREYLARRSGQVRFKHLVPARCPIFGYSLDEMKIDGQYVRQTFLRPELQSKLGFEGYDAGAKILTDFIKSQIKEFLTDDLDPIGRKIIETCLNDGSLEDYLAITPMTNIK